MHYWSKLNARAGAWVASFPPHATSTKRSVFFIQDNNIYLLVSLYVDIGNSIYYTRYLVRYIVYVIRNVVIYFKTDR
jgi:hypothetical protein